MFRCVVSSFLVASLIVLERSSGPALPGAAGAPGAVIPSPPDHTSPLGGTDEASNEQRTFVSGLVLL